MSKIKITEKQAELLGFKNIKENDDDIKSVRAALGSPIIRIVVSGPNVPRTKDMIMKIINRQDTEASVGFFEATGKIVGNVKEIRYESIVRDLRMFDATIVVERKKIAKALKEGVKNVVKISKEQYNRIFATINENDPKGGLTRVDKSFKKEFAGKDIQNLKSVSEDDFKISKPNKSLPTPVSGKFMKPITEDIGSNDIKKEIQELIKYLYRKSEELSPFWEQNGLSYDDICKALLSKNLIIDKGGKYEVSKKLGSPQAAMQSIEDELQNLIKPGSEVEATETAPEMETESGSLPVGAANDSRAPFNQKDDTTTPIQSKDPQLSVVAYNGEVALLQGPDGALYTFYYHDMDRKQFADYATLGRTYVGKDEDGQPEYEYSDEFEVDGDVIGHYVNDNLSKLTKGEGLEAYESGIDLVKVDEPLKQELSSLYDKDKGMSGILNPIDEVTEPEAIDDFKQSIKVATTPTNKPKPDQSKIVAKLKELKAKEQSRRQSAGEIEEEELDEMTGASSSGTFTGPLGGAVVKREMPTTPVVSEAEIGKGYTHFAIYKPTNKIVDGWDYKGLEPDEIKHWSQIDLKDNFRDNKLSEFKVVSRGFLLRNNIDPTNTDNWNKTGDVLQEMSTVASAGNFQYDTPGLANVGRNGEFKNGPKTKAEKTTQWAGGSFVKQPDCSKPNNNKSAQNGGCNSGASSLKTIKTGGSINAPSLGESVKLSPQQQEHLKRINSSTLPNLIKQLNANRQTPDTVGPQFKASKWWAAVEFNDNNGMWYPATDKEMTGILAHKAMKHMNEDGIYEAIAKKTGKTIDEVKEIINQKKKVKPNAIVQQTLKNNGWVIGVDYFKEGKDFYGNGRPDAYGFYDSAIKSKLNSKGNYSGDLDKFLTSIGLESINIWVGSSVHGWTHRLVRPKNN